MSITSQYTKPATCLRVAAFNKSIIGTRSMALLTHELYRTQVQSGDDGQGEWVNATAGVLVLCPDATGRVSELIKLRDKALEFGVL